MKRSWCTAIAGGIRLSVQIMPNAKITEVVGILNDALKIRLQAPPVEGKANDALIRYLADILDVPKTSVSITHGHMNKRKTIEVNAHYLTDELAAQALLGTGQD